MPRPIWKGSISFGLVNVPVSLYPAEKKKELNFHLIDKRNNAHIRYEKVNDSTGEPVPKEEIQRSFALDDGRIVPIEDDDFKRAKAEATQTIDIQDFVKAEEIDRVYYDKPYYLAPQKRGEKGYVLLRETLKRTNTVGIARVVLRTREYLAALIAEGDMLLLELLRYPQELRSPADLDLPREEPATYKINEREIAMAEKLVESMTSAWDPHKYRDTYTDALVEWIEQKARGETRALPPPSAQPEAEVIDITELLRESVQKAEEVRAPQPKKKKERNTLVAQH